MPKGYFASQTSVSFMNYHFVWCPKCRAVLTVGQVESRLKELIQVKAGKMSWKIFALATTSDQGHHLVHASRMVPPNRIVAAFKGYTSHELREEFSELTSRLPSLWTWSYFVSAHGHVSSETISREVEEQKCV
jgi:putative transposase